MGSVHVEILFLLQHGSRKGCTCTFGYFWAPRPVLSQPRAVRACVRVLTTRSGNLETSKFRSAGTSKNYRRTIYSGTASDEKIMKIRTHRVLHPGFTMHA